MTNGTSQGLNIVVAIVIFGIFVLMAYIIFEDTLTPAMASMFTEAIERVQVNIDDIRNSVGKPKDVEEEDPSNPGNPETPEDPENPEDVLPHSDYIFDPNTGTILEYIGRDTHINIPDTLEGETVVAIDGDAFYDKGLISVVMPDTITYIHDSSDEIFNTKYGLEHKGSFSRNPLTHMTLSKNLTHIGKRTFQYTYDLQDIQFPESVSVIGEAAFFHSGLTNLTLPSQITVIEPYTFFQNQLVEVNLPAGLKVIEDLAFEYNHLQQIELPEGLEYIGHQAFGNNDLRTLTIPDSVDDLGQVLIVWNPNFETVYLHVEWKTYVEFNFEYFRLDDENTQPNFVYHNS